MSSAACRGGDTCYLGTFGLVPNTTAEVTLSIEAYAPTADPPVVCPVMVELATGNMATADVNENGQADDCFVGDYDAPLTLLMPTQPTAPYGWYGAYVTFPSDAPDYEGPADQGGIWGYWWFNADANGHFLHIWPFWSAGARQTAAAVVPGSQGQGAARTEPRLYTNMPPRLFARLLPVETQHAASPPAASPPPRPPQPATIIHTPPVLADTAAIAYTRQRATLTLAGMTIAIHVTDTSAPDELVYVFADHLGSATILADDSGTAIPGSNARYLPFGDWRTEPTADETSRWYTGHVHDNLSHNDLGLIYMNARFYLPGVARFLSADTLVPDPANPQNFNRFTYVNNQPLLLTDPSGHCAEFGDDACWSTYDYIWSYVQANPEQFYWEGSMWTEDSTWENLASRNQDELESIYELLAGPANQRAFGQNNDENQVAGAERVIGNGARFVDNMLDFVDLVEAYSGHRLIRSIPGAELIPAAGQLAEDWSTERPFNTKIARAFLVASEGAAIDYIAIAGAVPAAEAAFGATLPVVVGGVTAWIPPVAAVVAAGAWYFGWQIGGDWLSEEMNERILFPRIDTFIGYEP